ncbi:MAG: DUF938 domain-containing protein [Candidatus Eremiobacteraeota bacterium]|nr:DUF938 domain-containing protein [Candidatus Eremiobacteraeota bacterium]
MLDFPSTYRNRDAILAVLKEVLPERGLSLEVASGSGQHAVYFANALPHLRWQPSDCDPQNLASIAAYRQQAGLANLLEPVLLDCGWPRWPHLAPTAMVCINMVHISPWESTLGLLAGAGRLLPRGGPLYLYGAYLRDEVETVESNLAFDRSLRLQNPAWGIRRLEAVTEEAEAVGLELARVVEMPANNLSVVFTKR